MINQQQLVTYGAKGIPSKVSYQLSCTVNITQYKDRDDNEM